MEQLNKKTLNERGVATGPGVRRAVRRSPEDSLEMASSDAFQHQGARRVKKSGTSWRQARSAQAQPKEVRRIQEEVPGVAEIVLVAVFELAAADRAANVRSLAEYLGFSRRQVASALDSLARRGWVNAERVRLTLPGLVQAVSWQSRMRRELAA